MNRAQSKGIDLIVLERSGELRTEADLALNRADAVIQPTVAWVVCRMHEAAEQLSHARSAEHREPLPLEQDYPTVVCLKNSSELGHERTIGPLPGEVGRAVAGRDAPSGAPLGQQEAAPFDAGV